MRSSLIARFPTLHKAREAVPAPWEASRGKCVRRKPGGAGIPQAGGVAPASGTAVGRRGAALRRGEPAAPLGPVRPFPPGWAIGHVTFRRYPTDGGHRTSSKRESG